MKRPGSLKSDVGVRRPGTWYRMSSRLLAGHCFRSVVHSVVWEATFVLPPGGFRTRHLDIHGPIGETRTK